MALVDLTNMPSPQLQKMRQSLRKNVFIYVVKKRMIGFALKNISSEKQGIEKLYNLTQNTIPALLFTSNNPFKLFKVWKVVESSIETDINFPSMIVLGREMLKVDGNIKSSAVPDEILISPPKSQRYDYQYVFVPRTGDWIELQSWIKTILPS